MLSCFLLAEEITGKKRNMYKVLLYMFKKYKPPGGVLPRNRLMGMCRWMGSHFHDWIDYNGVAFSLGTNRVTRMGSHICGISGVSKSRQVGIWGIFAQK